MPEWLPTIRRCPTHGRRPRTSSGRDRYRGSVGARRSSGATTSSSRPSSTRRSRSRPSQASTSATGRRRQRRTGGWSTTSTSAPARCAGREKSAALPPGKAKHLKNSYASETAVTDGERVYFYFANAGLFAFDFSGKPLWSKSIGPFKTRNNWGAAASPVLHRDRIYIVNDNDEQSFVAAYDARTGAEVWKVERKEGTNWSSPFVWENEQRTEIVTSGSDRVRSYDLSGKLLWELSGMSTISIPTPFSRFGLLYISSGYIADPRRPAYAIRPGASGDISLKPGETSNQYIVWSSPTGAPYNPTPIVYGDVYYTLFDRGFFTSHDARTGKEIYGRQRITAEASGFTSSPWAYNGKIFAMSEEGDTYVIQAGPEFKVLGKNSLNEMTLATPAISRGSLIVRTASKLYRITKGTTK